MKKIVLIIAAVLCLTAPAMAMQVADFELADGKSIHTEGEKNGKYIEVKTDHATYRIYPCGQLEKLTWKELNPNEDTAWGRLTYQGDVITLPHTTTVPYNTTPGHLIDR